MDSQYYYDQINKVLLYIEKNIDNKINLEDLASIAGFSPFHFHRIFSAYVGESLSIFIRRLKLEKSAFKLKYETISITEIAYEAGYETPAAFTRAFRQLFGISPSEYKFENNRKYFLQREKEYYIKLKEIVMKNFIEIKELQDMNVISVRRTGNYSDSANEAWSVLCKFAYPNRIINSKSKFIGISYDDPTITPEEKLRYDACITIDKDIKVEGEILKNTIKGGKYAVFLHKGPYENFMETYSAIFMEWLPNSNQELRELPCFELYLNSPEKTKPENLKTEIYLPIK